MQTGVKKHRRSFPLAYLYLLVFSLLLFVLSEKILQILIFMLGWGSGVCIQLLEFRKWALGWVRWSYYMQYSAMLFSAPTSLLPSAGLLESRLYLLNLQRLSWLLLCMLWEDIWQSHGAAAKYSLNISSSKFQPNTSLHLDSLRPEAL